MLYPSRATLSTAAVAFAFVLASCGDSKEAAGGETPTKESTPAVEPQTLTKAELIAEGDKICKEMRTAVSEIEDGETPQAIAGSVGKTITAYEAMLADLQALAPPQELADDYQAWLDANDEYKALLAQFKTVAADNDEAAGEQLQPKMNAQTEKLTSMSKAIGFKVCTQ